VTAPWLYEPFNYPGGALAGNAEGFGFTGAWYDPEGQGGGQVAATGLTFGDGNVDLVSSGRAALMPNTHYTAAARDVDISAIPPDYRDTQGKVGAPGKTIWLSFLGQVPVNDGIEAAMGIEFDDVVSGGRFVGMPWCWADFGPCSAVWGLALGGTSVFTASPATAVSLVVASHEFPAQPGGTARTRLWINPNIANRAAPGVADIQLDGADFRFTRLRVLSWEGISVDEIRLGPSYESVTPVE
jgi:hypothetical protein